MPKVSIIIPTYNSSRFIKRTIGSVLAQTFRDWELIIVDDCSRDSTELAVREFAKFDKRIKFIKTPENSGGPATPKNIGLENAVGEYVAFLDHDDEWFPEKLEKQLRVFQNSKDENLGLVSCYINLVEEKTKKNISKHTKLFRGDVLPKIIKENFIVTTSSVMIKNEIIKKIGFFDSSFKTFDDWDMWIRIAEKGYYFDFVNSVLINYISHGENAYFNNSKRKDDQEFTLIYKKHNEIISKYSMKMMGHYYLYQKDYKKARECFLKNIQNKNIFLEEKIKTLGFIFLTYFPKSEKLLRKIWRKLK